MDRAFDYDASFNLAHPPRDDSQTETRTALLSGKEWLEDFFLYRSRNAQAIIGHGQMQLAISRVTAFDFDLSAALDCLHGIEHEVDQNLFERCHCFTIQ